MSELKLPWGISSFFKGGVTDKGEPVKDWGMSMCPRCCAMVYHGLEYQLHHEDWHYQNGEVIP